MTRRCTATTKKGKPCRNMAEWGMDVCGPHHSQSRQQPAPAQPVREVREPVTVKQEPRERTTIDKLMAELEASIARARRQQ